MKSIALVFCIFCTYQFMYAHKPKSGVNVSHIAYDKDVSTDEQINPIFRWPLPEISGEAFIKVNVVVVELQESESVPTEAVVHMQKFISELYGDYGIFFDFEITKGKHYIKDKKGLKDLENGLAPLPNNILQIAIVPIEGLDITSSCVLALNDIASNHAVVGFAQDNHELAVFGAKSIGVMLGLLPTYYESSKLGVSAEDYNNCGRAGDFVCDTPFDYMGIKNDVKKKNCKYVGDFKSVDPTNIMSNSWSECMSYISPEQANKIKYNLIEIPSLNTVLGNESTLAIANKD